VEDKKNKIISMGYKFLRKFCGTLQHKPMSTCLMRWPTPA